MNSHVFVKIKIKNFKSFSNVSVNLKDFNVFVGESASGKSNFIESLMFLKNLSLNSLQAINNHGGFFIQNLKHESNSPTCIRAVLIDDEYNICLNYPISENNMANIYFKSIDYEICINYNKNNLDFVCESIKFDFEIYDKSYSDSSLLFKNSLFLKNDNGIVSSSFKNVDDNLNLEFFTPKSLINIINSNFKRKVSLLINSPLSSFPFDWANYFKEIHFYDFNPKVSKSVYGNGNINLSKDGENLALVLDNILNVKDNKRKFINLSSSLLPYIKDIGVENISDGKIFKLFEKYDKKPIFSPFLMEQLML